LVEVCKEYRLASETFEMAVDFLDRFLSRVPLHRTRLQLLGVVCALLAAKMEEISPPRIADLIYISDGIYRKKEVFELEHQLLDALEFRTLPVTALQFLNLYATALSLPTTPANGTPTLYHLAHYLIELGIVGCGNHAPAFAYNFPNSLLAIAALDIAFRCFRDTAASGGLPYEFLSQITNNLERDNRALRHAIATLEVLFRTSWGKVQRFQAASSDAERAACKQQWALITKFNLPDFGHVSTQVAPPPPVGSLAPGGNAGSGRAVASCLTSRLD
jgi:hypothetical protein